MTKLSAAFLSLPLAHPPTRLRFPDPHDQPNRSIPTLMLAMSSPPSSSPYASLRIPHDKAALLRQSQHIHDRSVAELETALSQHNAHAQVEDVKAASSMHIEQALDWLSANAAGCR